MRDQVPYPYKTTSKIAVLLVLSFIFLLPIQGADKSLARPGRKQATVTEDFEFRISYL